MLQTVQELKDGCTTARGRFVPAPRMFPFSKTTSLGCDAKTLRQEQQENPKSALSRLGLWLAKCSAEGSVSRQEVVSTVPVAMLGIERGHVVLDLCAAPGSKTLQALELAGDGAVIANELSASRACVLARRCSSQPAAAAVAVVQHKAQLFPTPALYDRIICDVPCSGDGTMRKHPEKWRNWSPHLGRELHSRQLQIALRAMALLKVGGLMTFGFMSVKLFCIFWFLSCSFMFYHSMGSLFVCNCTPERAGERWCQLKPTVTWITSNDCPIPGFPVELDELCGSETSVSTQ